MENKIDLRSLKPKEIYPLGGKFSGTAPDGRELGFTNYYMTMNGRPFFGVCGEIHFSRVSPDQWEDTIVKAKMGGVNIIATYVFWNVHEEVEGRFRFDGRRDLRAFLELCWKHGLYVILRVGPFAHGEMRNGGFPDWLYGKPYESRNRNEGFLEAVRKYFAAIHGQTDGLYFGQGGPIIAAQLDNEYMHAGAPWERTAGVSKEWVSGGTEGEAYMVDLKRVMQEVGIVTPFYTCTAWGGAAAPVEEALPLWGGYAYWPWIFYEKREGGHPATPEYIYRDNHNNAVPSTYNFEPHYPPESMPYACCEMMGGMNCGYSYRFQLDFKSVDAMCNIKLGSGCNLLGYYMYRGGTTPTGETIPYLNEGQMPQLSYDFQAPIGEYGQLRPSYHRLRLLHYFCQAFGEQLCRFQTVLPPEAKEMEPTETRRLRYSVRTDGESGFVFLNNFQDHFDLPPRKNESILLQLPQGELKMEGLGLASGENAILPFNLDMDGVTLRYAAAQPITRIGKTWFFLAPEGMAPAYHFDASTVRSAVGCSSESKAGLLCCKPAAGKVTHFTVVGTEGAITIVTLPRADSLNFYQIDCGQGETAFLSDAPLLWDGKALKAETQAESATICVYPAGSSLLTDKRVAAKEPAAVDIFQGVKLHFQASPASQAELKPVQVGPSRYTLSIPQEALKEKTVLLRLEYLGDVGHAFINGEMIADNFYNGGVWDIRVDNYADQLAEYPLTIYISPIKENSSVSADSPMAARKENVSGIKAALKAAWLQPAQEITILAAKH